jgi:hypothetical protein
MASETLHLLLGLSAGLTLGVVGTLLACGRASVTVTLRQNVGPTQHLHGFVDEEMMGMPPDGEDDDEDDDEGGDFPNWKRERNR